MVKGAIYYPTKKSALENIINYSNFTEKDKLVDLGSGDGRIVIAFARKGIPIDGYEINPLLVMFSRWWIRKEGLQKLAKIYYKSFWNVNLSQYTGVIVFGITYIMKDLAIKLKKEMPQNTEVVSGCFTFPEWHPYLKKDTIYFYRVEKNAKN